MADLEDRLVRCFSSVFPDLTDEQIRAANVKSVSSWDSLATVNLLAVIEQEFSVEIEVMDFPELGSFEAVRSYLHGHKLFS
jgi:acyl carrier protein